MDAPTVIQSRVIGARLVETNLISDEQLERALELQEENGRLLGQILLEEFGVSQLDFASVLAGHDGAEDPQARPDLRLGPDLEPEASEPLEPLTPAGVRIRRPIGEIFVENGFITSAQLESALEVQQRTGARIGEILIEQGVLTRLDLASALAEHWEPPAAAAVQSPLPLEGAPLPLQRDLGPSVADLDAIADLGLALTRLEETRIADARAAEARLATLEEAAAMLAGLEERVRESVAAALAVQTEALPVQAEDFEAAATAALEQRLAALADVVAGVRAEVEVVAGRPGAEDPGERLAELAGRLDRAEAEGREKIDGLAEDLGRRLAEVAGRVDGLADRDDAGALEEQVVALAAVLDGVRGEIEALASRPEDLGRRLEELAARIDGLVDRDDAVAPMEAVEERISGLAAVLDGMRGEIEALASRPDGSDPGERPVELADLIDRASAEGREKIDGLAEDLGRRLAEVAGRVDGLVDRDEAVAASRADRADLEARTLALDSQVRVQHDETAALRALVEESLANAGGTAWQEPIESMLEQRLETLESRLTVEAASARADADKAIDTLRGEARSLAARIDEMLSLRHDDAQAARDSNEDLVDRLASIARSVADVEARYAAREESSVDLEATVTSLTARLGHIEESAPGNETVEVALHVADLESRVEALIAIGEEQARVTERAISTGLASLGKRVAGSKKKYSKKGKGRRRSIERLGAAVIEAGARLADQIPVAETDGCVAFAPTADGYRLVELRGSPPQVGAKVKVKGCGGPLVVTRLGRSPLPFDARPCAYLDRA
jgi:hypothetical protein